MIEVDRFENTRVYIVRACVFTVSAPGRRVAIELTHGSSPSHGPSSTPNVLRPGPPAGGLLLLAISAKRKNRTPEARGRVGGAVPKTRSNLHRHRQFMRQL